VILLDTNVLSELMRPEPDERVVDWLLAQPAPSIFTSSITRAEILYGVILLAPGKRRDALEAAAQAMFAEDFGGRILGFSADAALPYARIAADRRRAARPISHFDAQIAAIATCSGAAIATRNTADFEGCGVEILNPWTHGLG